LLDSLDNAGKCDGILAAAHGATVSEVEPDADGYWLEELRQRVGPCVPIIGTLDLHANLSQRMVKACDAFVAYRTNPHVDQLACGRSAASLMVRTLRKEVRPTQAAAFPPVVINIELQDTSARPCCNLVEQANRIVDRTDVLSTSVLLGFPYADVAEMGPSALVVTNDNSNLAQNYANEMAEELWTTRKQYVPDLVSVEKAVEKATTLQGSVCLLDMGDNVGGGGPADGTWILHSLNNNRVGRAFVCLCDPTAVSHCESVGVGKSIKMAVGGRSGPLHGKPFEAQFRVLGLYDGKFYESEPRHGGYGAFDQGPNAVVRTDGDLTILLTSRRMAPFSLAQITSSGLDPSRFDILVAKGVIAPVAAYKSVCQHFIRVNTPGVTTADLSLLPYRHRRKPMYPFETEFDWQPTFAT
jgi:microcystin degradation protein MlrC